MCIPHRDKGILRTMQLEESRKIRISPVHLLNPRCISGIGLRTLFQLLLSHTRSWTGETPILHWSTNIGAAIKELIDSGAAAAIDLLIL